MTKYELKRLENCYDILRALEDNIGNLRRKLEKGTPLYPVDLEDLEKQTREASGIVDWVLEDKDLETADQRAARLGEEG